MPYSPNVAPPARPRSRSDRANPRLRPDRLHPLDPRVPPANPLSSRADRNLGDRARTPSQPGRSRPQPSRPGTVSLDSPGRRRTGGRKRPGGQTNRHPARALSERHQACCRLRSVDALPAVLAQRPLHAPPHALALQRERRRGRGRSAIRRSAPAQSPAHRRDASLGSDLMRALPPSPQPLCPGACPRIAGTLLRHLRPRRPASSPARGFGISALSRHASAPLRIFAVKLKKEVLSSSQMKIPGALPASLFQLYCTLTVTGCEGMPLATTASWLGPVSWCAGTSKC